MDKPVGKPMDKHETKQAAKRVNKHKTEQVARRVDKHRLMEEAKAARLHAYAPYSGFRVGAALLSEDGRIHRGCNVENGAYSPTNCAERTALFRAIADGYGQGAAFQAIAIIADKECPVTPCGVCRQVMKELCPADMPVYMGNLAGEFAESTVDELLPGAFSL